MLIIKRKGSCLKEIAFEQLHNCGTKGGYVGAEVDDVNRDVSVLLIESIQPLII